MNEPINFLLLVFAFIGVYSVSYRVGVKFADYVHRKIKHRFEEKQ